MSLDRIFKEGLLRKEPPSEAKAAKSLKMAEKYLCDAKAALGIKSYDITVLVAYSAMFHAARAFLFRDGVKERSHWAMIEYLKEEHHAELGHDVLNTLDSYRSLRHSTAYGLETTNGEHDAMKAIEFAQRFVGMAKRLLAAKRS